MVTVEASWPSGAISNVHVPPNEDSPTIWLVSSRGSSRSTTSVLALPPHPFVVTPGRDGRQREVRQPRGHVARRGVDLDAVAGEREAHGPECRRHDLLVRDGPELADQRAGLVGPAGARLHDRAVGEGDPGRDA